MDGNLSTHGDDDNQFLYELNLDMASDSDGATGNSPDGNTWVTHPTAVDEVFQQQQSEFITPVPPGPDGTFSDWSSPGVPPDWTNADASSGLFASLPDPSAHPFGGALPYRGGPATSFNNVGGQSMVVPTIPPTMRKELAEDTLLRTLRDAGFGYSTIAKEFLTQLGVRISANALVKRYQKMPKTCEGVVAQAMRNIMHKVMEELYAELPRVDDGTLSAEQKQLVKRMVQELARILPGCVRSSLSRTRKRTRRSKQPSASL
ncbi:uncharacterized protein B0H64DRAFT_377974 [Chaetomium fimeti]|uniref:Uncharacterized protein n=1 Tax=Chaetomium fimeti TaxID=1854472 RepID=A0AAE0LN11_9PEZI|nr:hypothetical protein B0H64DRAFT_377974 [Chaetomium fimeti]